MIAEKHYQIIQRPVISEKSMLAIENNDEYHFIVHPEATRTDVKAAVEALFGVKVVRVNIANKTGKTKRTRNFTGKRSDQKKAYVKLQEGQTIEFLTEAE